MTKTTTAPGAPVEAKPETVAPIITAVRTDIAIPAKSKTNRGSKSVYNLDDLPVTGSIGITNKTVSQLRQIVSNANRKNMIEKRDEANNIVYKTKPLSGPNGVTNVPTEEPEMVSVKKFVVHDVDPKTDPDKATARIFREL